MELMPVWSTRKPGDPASVGHRMLDDFHGRPMSPVCGCSTEGLWFRRDHEWSQVPGRQRCSICERLAAGRL